MALAPKTEAAPSPAFRLESFDEALAPLIASWCGDGIEALWLAPRTPPPITGEKVLEWKEEGRTPQVMRDTEHDLPVGYGELNVLRDRRREYWLGHLLIDPSRRGRGLGATLTRLLVEKAFRELAARRVSLVVFPENHTAISAYKAAGLHFDGYETHHFAAYARRFELLRMDVRI